MISNTQETEVPIQAEEGANPAFDLIGLTDLRNDSDFAGIDGSGFTVAVIDTGLDRDHPSISPNYVTGVDFVYGGDNPTDRNGHGTHVAGIVGAANENIGVAPDVGLIGLQVFEPSGGASLTDIERALQWVLDNQEEYNIIAVNMSLGSGFYTSQEDEDINNDATFDEIRRLEQQGVTVVAAAGNSYKNNEYPNLAAPAIFSTLGVGAVWQDGANSNVQWGSGAIDYSTGADRITSFSQRLDASNTIFAPGAFITSTVPNGGLDRMAGTSQASPIVAGSVALMQEAAQQFRGRLLSPNEIVQIMRNTSDTIRDGDDEDDNVENTQLDFLRLNIYDAIRAIRDGSGGGDDGDDDNIPPPPTGDPNGTIAAAFIGPRLDGSPTSPIIGSIGVDGGDTEVGDTDVDIISFEVISPGQVSINVTSNSEDPADFDSYLRLFDESGDEIANDDDSGEDDFSSINVSLEPGTYYAGISGYNNTSYNPNAVENRVSGATGNYNLEFNLSNDDPNGLISGAVPINLQVENNGDPVSQQGFLGADFGEEVGTADVDIFEIVIPDNGVLLVDIDTPYDQDYADTYLRVFDADGNELVSSDDDLATDFAGNLVEFSDASDLVYGDVDNSSSFQGHTVDSFVAEGVEQGDVYYIAVSDYFNQDYDPNNLNNRSSQGEGGFYDILVSFANQDQNGSIPQARDVLSLPASDVLGYIGADFGEEVGDRDVDFVRINSDESGILEIDIDAYDADLADPVDSVVLLFDEDGNLIATNDDQAQGELDAFLQYPIVSDENYYVAIAGYGNQNFDPFQLASGSPGDTGEYIFNAQLLPPSEENSLSDGSVENGTISSLEIDELIFSNIGYDQNFFVGDRDLDIYRFQPENDQIIEISTNTSEQYSADTFLRIFDRNGYEIAYNDNRNDNTRASFIRVALEEGQEYFIGVNGTSENARDYDPITGDNTPESSQRGAYSLLLNTSDSGERIGGSNDDDQLEGTSHSDILVGKDGDDLIVGDRGHDLLQGDDDNDSLYGDSGNDQLQGGDGDDYLDGGSNEDLLTGNQSEDIFVLSRGNGVDTITDFTEDEDLIGLVDLDFEDLSFSGNQISVADSEEVLAILIGVDTANLSSNDFVVI